MLVNPIVRLCVFDDLMILMIHRADNPMTKAATTHKKFILSCGLILNPLLTKLIYFHLRCHSCFIHFFGNMDSSCPYKVNKKILLFPTEPASNNILFFWLRSILSTALLCLLSFYCFLVASTASIVFHLYHCFYEASTASWKLQLPQRCS